MPGAKWACSSHLRAGVPNRGVHTAASGLRLPWIAAPPPWSPLVHVHHPPLSVLHRGFGSAWRGEDRGTRRAQGHWAHGIRERPLWTRVVRLKSGICLAGTRLGAPDNRAVSGQHCSAFPVEGGTPQHSALWTCRTVDVKQHCAQ